MFHKHLCSQKKIIGQIVIWLMWVPAGCPRVCNPARTLLNYSASEQEDTTCHGLPGRCVGVGCLAWSWESQWVVCATVADVQDCADASVSNMMFIPQRKQPFAGVRNNPVLHTESWMHGQLLISRWHLLYEFVHYLSRLSCKINAFDRTGIFFWFDFHKGKFLFLWKAILHCA